MKRIREAILVEGKYDKNALCQIVDAPVFVTGGFGIFKDRAMVAFLRQVAEQRGLVIFTDSDGAGFVIRNHLKGVLPAEKLLHAYIPDIPGKERRKDKPSREGLLGVEGMTPEIILEALRRAGAHFEDAGQAPPRAAITRQDLYRLGLSGGPDSSALREQVKRHFRLPARLGPSGFLDALNMLTDLKTLEQIVEKKAGTAE